MEEEYERYLAAGVELQRQMLGGFEVSLNFASRPATSGADAARPSAVAHCDGGAWRLTGTTRHRPATKGLMQPGRRP